IRSLFELGRTMAVSAATMTDTTMEWRILGSAWPRHFNKPLAEVLSENMKTAGMPHWTDADQRLAKALQHELKAEEKGLLTEVGKLEPPPPRPRGGGSDDIGDVSWVVPTAIV